MKYISCFLSWVIISLFMGCSNRAAHRHGAADVLSQMRSDTVFIHELDSMATLALGAEATCIDPVWHLFSCDGRRWFHNPDWGGVLELPDGFIPQDDYVQAELTFHGTTAISEDQKITLSFYAGFQAASEQSYMEDILDSFRNHRFNIMDIDTAMVEFPDGFPTAAYTIKAINNSGIICYGRYIPSGPNQTLFFATVTYQNVDNDRISKITTMIDRYPLSENGSFMKGEALL